MEHAKPNTNIININKQYSETCKYKSKMLLLGNPVDQQLIRIAFFKYERVKNGRGVWWDNIPSAIYRLKEEYDLGQKCCIVFSPDMVYSEN